MDSLIITTNVVLTLNEMVKVIHGEDVTLQLTNGAQISGGAVAFHFTAAVAAWLVLRHCDTTPRRA